MAKEDLKKFLYKVEQLQQMVNSLNHFDDRRDLLAACEDHNQVVSLARSWGYEIGRRWGEADYELRQLTEENLLGRPIPLDGQQDKYLIQESSHWRLELISSCNSACYHNRWDEFKEHEWMLILRGSLLLRLKDSDSMVELNVGDHFYLAPHSLHRLEKTDPSPGSAWLALFWIEEG